jgi:hypothetical protein
MCVCCRCCVLSGRGLCVGMITLPEKSYRVWCVWVWSWILDNEKALVHWGLLRHSKKNIGRTEVKWDATVSGLCLRYFIYLLTYSMEQSPSWEANRFCS